MVRAIYQNKMDAGRIESHQDAPVHDCLTWICPKGHLEGPKNDGARCLGTAMERAVDKAVPKIDFTVAGRIGKKKEYKVALNRKLHNVCNRRRSATPDDLPQDWRLLGRWCTAGDDTASSSATR